jgi:LysM repeat protein
MKFKILIFSISLLIVSQSLFARSVIDSIGVKNQDGKKVILFKVKAKDTYYSIGRRYDVKPQVIMKFNNSKKETLTIGAIVKVPTGEPYKASHKEKATEKIVKETKKEKKERLTAEAREERIQKRQEKDKEQEQATVTPVNVQQSVPTRTVQQPPVQQPVKQEPEVTNNDNLPTLQYKVSAGETLYGIAKRFNSTVDDISKLNNLSGTNLTAGEILLVRSNSANPKPAPVQQLVVHTTMPVAKRDSTFVAPIKDSSTADRHLNANKFGLYEKTEKGVATWMDDASLDAGKKLVLHRTAPIGTVIKITNPMTNRTTYAKVVGRFPDSETTKDVIIIFTKNVAESLGGLDKRFRVIITYGSPNE